MRRFRGFIELMFDTVEDTTNLVERTHQGVVERSVRRFVPKGADTKVAETEVKLARGVFHAIRSVNGLARKSVATSAISTEQLPQLATPVRSTASGTASWYVDGLQSTVNGFFGDTLSRRGSDLDLGMTIRHHGHLLPIDRESLADAFPGATPKVCVFIHGLSATEWLWSHSAEEHYGEADVTFGTRLESDLGFTPIYIRYNSGRRVADNGRLLSELLAGLIDAYPQPIEEIALVGHSMGGLVARSAAHYGRESNAPWVTKLRHVVCIGSPHHGSPPAKAADLVSNVLLKVDAAAAQVIAELLEARSEGIRDLEHGTIVDDESPAPFVDGVGYYFVASTVTKDPEHPLGQLVGDLLVRLPSASGEAKEVERHIPFHSGAVFSGLNHFDIASHPEVYEALRDQIAGATSVEH